MELQSLIFQQRIKHIIDSYHLLGSESEADVVINGWQNLISTYPPYQLEMAVVSCLVAVWLEFPLPRGYAFLERLNKWLIEPEFLPVSIEQFRQLTGLEPLQPTRLSFSSAFLQM